MSHKYVYYYRRRTSLVSTLVTSPQTAKIRALSDAARGIVPLRVEHVDGRVVLEFDAQGNVQEQD